MKLDEERVFLGGENVSAKCLYIYIYIIVFNGMKEK